MPNGSGEMHRKRLFKERAGRRRAVGARSSGEGQFFRGVSRAEIRRIPGRRPRMFRKPIGLQADEDNYSRFLHGRKGFPGGAARIEKRNRKPLETTIVPE